MLDVMGEGLRGREGGGWLRNIAVALQQRASLLVRVSATCQEGGRGEM